MFTKLIDELKNIFKEYNENGFVTTKYETVIYAGRLG
jgi:hypothetical protein